MNKKENQGFSLVELIVVIAIMAVFTGVLAPMLINYVEDSRMEKDDAAMGEYTNAIRLAMTQNDEIYNDMFFLAQDVGEDALYIVFYEDEDGKGLTPHLFDQPLKDIAPTLNDKINSMFPGNYSVESFSYRGESYTVSLKKDMDGELKEVTGAWGEQTNTVIGNPNDDDEPMTPNPGPTEPSPSPTTPSEPEAIKEVAQYTPPTPVSPLKYNGTPQVLITPGETAEGTMLYKIGGGEWTSSLPEGTNVGTYTVKYYVKGDINHSDSSIQSISVTMEKGDPEVIAPTGLIIPYDGNSHQLVNPGSTTGGTLVYTLNTTWSTTIPSESAEGEYIIQWRVNGNSNWNGVAGDAVVSIIQSGATPVPNPDKTDAPDIQKASVKGKSWNYNGSEYTVTPTGTGWTFSFSETEGGSYSSTKPVRSTVGKTMVYWKATHAQYNDVTGVAELVCNPVETDYTAPTALTLTYNGNSQELIAPGSVAYGTMYYRLGTNGTWSTSIPTATDVNSNYNVFYYIKGDENHLDRGSESNPAGFVTAQITN